MPLAEDPQRAGATAVGALVVIAAGALLALLMWQLRVRGVSRRIHELSKKRNFGMELRIALIAVFGLAGLAQALSISVMLAGFVAGLALTVEGQQRRLSRQLFAVTSGFLGPVFYIWLGASLDLRALANQPRMIALAALLAVGTFGVHTAARFLGQPLPLAVLAGAQLGVPIAAVTIGTDNHLLQPGEGGAVLAAALVSVATTAWAANRIAAARGEGA